MSVLRGDEITMSIHSGGFGIATRLCDLEARLLGANEYATHPRDQEDTCERESTCNRRTWKVVCQRGRYLSFLDIQPSLDGTGM